MLAKIKILIFLNVLCYPGIYYIWSQEIPHRNMPLDCNVCHDTNNWQSINYDHNQTDFTLEGQHSNVKCKNCHTLEDFAQIQSNCNFCHIDVHQGKLAYPCENCHHAVGWQVLDIYSIHSNTTFPVLGSHSRLDCAACHKSEIVGEYNRLQSDCYSCHATDYQQAQNPVHNDFGFGQRCEDCHSMLAWIPGMFADHESRFPISSGAHAGTWENCNICHTNPANYQVFSCLNCHEHNQAGTVRRHDEVRGFVYNSDACYQCHRNGRAED